MTETQKQCAVRVGVIGHGIQASRTPAMHEAAGQALGIEYRYELIDTENLPDRTRLETLVSDAEAGGFTGLNVTFPYKREVMTYLDHLSDEAKAVGAVNTVVFRDGKRFGHNTDFWGFAEGMRQNLRGADLSSVLMLGAGGAGGAAAHAMRTLGTEELLIHDLDSDKAARLASETAGVPVSDVAEAAAKAAGIVNATPMGMAKLPGTALPISFLRRDHWVMDIVYFPMETALLKAARQLGCRTANGSGMALYQAVCAFELFAGLKPDPVVMKARFDAFDQD